GVVLALQLRGEGAPRITQLLGHLVTADSREVVALRVEEEVLQQRPRGLRSGRFARTEAPVDVLEGLLLRLEVVLLERELDGRGTLEELEDLVLRPSQRLQEHGDV